MKNIITGAIILFMTAVVIALIAFPKPRGSTAQSQDERTTDVKIMEVRTGPLSVWLELPASAEPFLSTVVSAEIDGRIDWIGPTDGDILDKPGKPLVRIDQRTFRAQLNEAQAAYDLASDDCRRLEQLHKEGIATDEQLDRCRSRMEADVARLEVAKIQLEKATISAPIAGVLNKSYVEIGEYVRKGDRIADIVVIDPVKVVTKVPEKDVPYIRKGQKIYVSLEFIREKSYEGTVSYISVVGDQATRTYNVEITVPNPNLEILPSMIATVRSLRTEIAGAITIPLVAVIPRGDYSLVFVEEDGKARERLVEFGILVGNGVQILKGLEPGDRLIVEGQRELADGEPVQVRSTVGVQ
jgi:membrane fusion protein (multidrug efflux system)